MILEIYIDYNIYIKPQFRGWKKLICNTRFQIQFQININSCPPSAAYASVNRVSIGSDKGLSPNGRQAII